MTNSEKIDAYFENSLSADERISLEKEITENSELRQEFEFQQDVIEGIKNTRVKELKTMLDNVPVGSTGLASTLSAAKVTTAVIVLALITYGVFEFTSYDEELIPTKVYNEEVSEDMEELNNEPSQTDVSVPSTIKKETKSSQKISNEQNEPEESITQNQATEKLEINKPSEAPIFETSNSDSLEAPTNDIINESGKSTNATDVKIDNTKRRYDFHYNFENGKLNLYGSFDKELYEIIEFNTQADKAIFLNYKDQFFALDKDQIKIKRLEPIEDSNLINKLNQLIQSK